MSDASMSTAQTPFVPPPAATATLDLSRWPIVVSQLPSHADEAEVDANFAAWRAVFALDRPYIAIVDFTHLGSSSPVLRRRSAAFMKETEAVTRKLSLGTAYVVPSTWVRGVLTALFWLSQPAGGYVLVPTFDDALAWAQARLPAP